MKKDRQTVTETGALVMPLIDGLQVRHLPTIEDPRGEVVELFRETWGISSDPLVYVYGVSVRPDAIKGWTVHKKQDDRIAVLHGVLHWVFFDNREASPTYRRLNAFTFSDKNRALFNIPRGVFHAVQNLGTEDAFFVNMPTRPYDHADPDKYRLPLKNDLIPYDFSAIRAG